MTTTVMRRSLIAVLLVSGTAAGTAAIPTGPVDLVDVAAGTINAGDNRVGEARRITTGNPLWAIPLKDLPATRERPIFSPLRRPPTPAVATAPYTPPRPAKPAEPERPQLSLVGTVAGDKEGFGIFLDRSANTVLRLKTGEAHQGWILREVRSRETVLEKGDKTATLALPAPPRISSGQSAEDDKSVNRSRH